MSDVESRRFEDQRASIKIYFNQRPRSIDARSKKVGRGWGKHKCMYINGGA